MADNSHQRADTRRRKTRAFLIAAPLAVVATAAAVGVGVVAQPAEETTTVGVDRVATNLSGAAARRSEEQVSRSKPVVKGGKIEKKPEPGPMSEQKVQQAVAAADDEVWTTTVLNLWPNPWTESEGDRLGVVDEIEQVVMTGRKIDGRTEIVLDGESRWVTSGYLQAEKPEPEPEETETEDGDESEESTAPSGTGGTCSNGTSVPSGVSPHVSTIHQNVCARFPEIGTYGTFRSGSGDHASGRAVDVMVSGDRGWQVAEYVRANASAFGVSYVIYAQKIWSVDRAGEGWRWMEDRGSTTANHYDHVHVSVY